MGSILQYFNLPNSCYFGNNIPKKMFYDNGSLSTADKKLFIDTINKITLNNQLNEQTINIKSYKDGIRSYEEIAFITINLSEEKKYKRIAQIVQQTIPYPIVLLLECDSKTLINVCHKRTNQADSTKNTIEEHYFASWLDMEALETNEEQFLKSLNVPFLSHANFYNFYNDFVDRVILYKASRYATDFNSIKDMEVNKVNQILHQIELIDFDIISLRNKIKNEVHFNKKMEMNMEIKKLDDTRRKLIGCLQ
ncbi:MAG: DUF4391 domain-containing protein [Peptostreptococcales bacterium]